MALLSLLVGCAASSIRRAGPNTSQPSTAAHSLVTAPVSVAASQVVVLSAAAGHPGTEKIRDGTLIVPVGIGLQFSADTATTRYLEVAVASGRGNSPLNARTAAILPLAVLQGHVRVTITVPADGKTHPHTLILQADRAALIRQMDGGWLVQVDEGVLRVGPW